jgi:hypothetical protein
LEVSGVEDFGQCLDKFFLKFFFFLPRVIVYQSGICIGVKGEIAVFERFHLMMELKMNKAFQEVAKLSEQILIIFRKPRIVDTHFYNICLPERYKTIPILVPRHDLLLS